MDFRDVVRHLQVSFNAALQGRVLFETDIDKDRLWALYLESFPNGANPIYRVRTLADCSCCRNFLRNIGGTVYIDDDFNVHSIFEFDANSPDDQPSLDAMAAYVKSRPIVDIYVSKTAVAGTKLSREMNEETGEIKTYYHYYLELPGRLVLDSQSDTIDTKKAKYRDTRNVFKRSLDEISLDALQTVAELIASNSLYKGEEWGAVIQSLIEHKRKYDALSAEKKALYCWAKAADVGPVIGRIRNHSMGVLLTDISGGMDLDSAVRRYEQIVAPANYKRPKPIFTKEMLEKAQQAIAEMGFMESLPRRFATLDDITINNILFSNRDAARRIGGSVFDDMLADVKPSPKQFSRVEEIGVDRFISEVLPTAVELEVFMESRFAPNMVSLIAPVNRDAPTMFKWNNGFCWAYAGNMTDSDIRENVKNAGGRVDGVLRFSLQWNDIEEDKNDLDAHCKEPEGGEYIYFSHKISGRTRGNLDIDIINPKTNVPAVENITYPNKAKMLPGDYVFIVHCYTNRGGRSGFRAEIEFDGQAFRFDYDKPMRQDEKVKVATVTLGTDGRFTIKDHLGAQASSREIWGIKCNQFVPVSVVMYSPNYWDEQTGIGHRHVLFMLKGCVNPENPNGFYNEFIRNELSEHKRVLEALGARMAVESVDDQLSGIGFSATKRNVLVVKVKGATERVMKVQF